MPHRMLDFAALRNEEVTIDDLAGDLTVTDLHELNDGMVDTILDLITGATDADVVFVPVDEEADDRFAEDEADRDLAWTLGHLVVHVTASCEESAALGAELARGVEFHGRSRSEVPWQTVKTIQQCLDRLEESRRMCAASLDMWPDEPYLENTYEPRPGASPVNAVKRFVSGLRHADSHLEQIADVLGQAKAG